MSRIRFLLDENVERALATALQRRLPEAAVWMAGDPGAPPRGTLDPDVLLWCEANAFCLLTNNRSTMPGHLRDHLAAGRHVPGIFVLSPAMSLGAIVNELELLWAASEVEEYRDLLLYLPLTT